ncbi:hypothetical protein [Shouchella patagoniensis]|uniref:hypothetical protein n=1 Tax=Shouchella patagoniensis TaxID=228576 RepID=UPI001117184D|nr:hypothetical protein [Shouchella patagoniensis]
MIKQKGLSYTYGFTLIYGILLLIVLQNDIVAITAFQMLTVIMSLVITTAFISFVSIVKKY